MAAEEYLEVIKEFFSNAFSQKQLTREAIAANNLHALLMKYPVGYDYAEVAVKMADELLAELEKTKK